MAGSFIHCIYKLEKSMAPQHLKSPWQLSSRSLHPTLVIKRSWSWSWMADSYPFRSMSIGPRIPDILLFQNLTLKIHGKGHACGQRSRSHCWPSNHSINFLFISNQLVIPFLRYSDVKIWPWKLPAFRVVQGDCERVYMPKDLDVFLVAALRLLAK